MRAGEFINRGIAMTIVLAFSSCQANLIMVDDQNKDEVSRLESGLAQNAEVLASVWSLLETEASSRDLASDLDVAPTPAELAAAIAEEGVEGSIGFLNSIMVEMDGESSLDYAYQIFDDERVISQLSESELASALDALHEVELEADAISLSMSAKAVSATTIRAFVSSFAAMGTAAVVYAFVPWFTPWVKAGAAIALGAAVSVSALTLAALKPSTPSATVLIIERAGYGIALTGAAAAVLLASGKDPTVIGILALGTTVIGAFAFYDFICEVI